MIFKIVFFCFEVALKIKLKFSEFLVMASKDNLVNMLLDMGFGNNRAVRGLQATGFKVSPGFVERFYFNS